MNILITNNTLASRAGTEMYVRDLALELRKRGHSPAAYSNVLGDVAEEIRLAGIPVVDNLEDLPWKPDILHCHHHLETMTALLYFTDVPAVYFYHGWRSWQEIPPRHPRIIEYVAVDEPCWNSAVHEHGVPADRIRIILNFVDLDRFKARGPLPSHPLRALVFSNCANERTHLPIVREACIRKGITLDAAGIGSGNPLKKPEEVIGSYDLVFAKGRAAVESLAVGCSVILCDEQGVGPMVTIAELDGLRRLNCGTKTFHSPLHPDNIIKEIDRYSADDAAQVTQRIRSTAGLDGAVGSILSLYEETIVKFTQLKLRPESEARSAADYLRWISSLIKEREALCNYLQTELYNIRSSLIIRIKNRLVRIPVFGQVLRFLFLPAKALLMAFDKRRRKKRVPGLM